jgi:hypothetical protein
MMISKAVIYKNGHFYDKQTHERFELVEGAELAITTHSRFVAETRSVGGDNIEIFKSEEVLAKKFELEKTREKISDYQRLLPQGSILFVWMSINPNINKNNEKTDKQNGKYLFKVILEEDLYAYIKSNWKEGRLCDCACTVIEEPTQKLSYFEMVDGKSLNEVYKNTFVHFFGNNGNPACNAIDRFLIDENNEDSKIRSLMTLG